MRPHAPSHPRIYALHLALGAVVLLGAQVAVHLLILDETVGGVRLLSAAPRRDPSMTREPRVILLRSEATARLWSREAYDRRVRAWTRALDVAELPYAVVPEAALAGALDRATAIVLPGATCLGEETREVVRGFVAQGHGVVATGAVGARDGECRWRGWDFLKELSGAVRAEAATLPGAVFATFGGGEFYEGAMPAGYRLELPDQELVLAEVEQTSVYASDWRLRPARGGRPQASALATHREQGKGRIVWLGFDESAAGRRPAAQDTLEAYLGVIAAWAARQPIATVATWPGGRPAAAMMVVVAGERKDRLAALVRTLGEAGVKGTFVAGAGGLPVDPGPGADLVTSGDRDDPFRGESLDAQRVRLVDARNRLAAQSGRAVAGFRPPGGATDAATIRAVAAAGLSYTVGEVGDLRATPELVEIPSRLLTVLPGRAVVRLFHVAAEDQEVLARGEDPAQAFIRDLERVVHLGGLYSLTLNADLAGSDELVPAVRSLLRHASTRGVWLASGSEVTQWWVERQGLQAASKQLSPYRLQIDLSNRGRDRAENVVVSVHLPYAPRRVAVRSPILHLSLPKHVLEGDVLRLTLADIGPQSNHTYVLSLDE